MHKTSHFFVKRMEYTERVMLFTGKIKKTYFLILKQYFKKGLLVVSQYLYLADACVLQSCSKTIIL